MVASLGKSKRIAVYVEHGVEEYIDEVDIDLTEGASNEPQNEDKMLLHLRKTQSNVNVEDTNQGTNEAEDDENEIVNEDNEYNEDYEATVKGQHDDNEVVYV
ncbi:uncharacterized protein A4U43_C01F14330 [Asparagus officinalis]|uniref:Uncharacterized protein n=1 Tax=Asparagus officinalis TaxID=4686 RepID=A0A5P1FPV4_ASPOF|nr:uncharacterized protein A4U43_C01F14330 [Asparagus officinalis]